MTYPPFLEYGTPRPPPRRSRRTKMFLRRLVCDPGDRRSYDAQAASIALLEILGVVAILPPEAVVLVAIDVGGPHSAAGF